MVAHAFPVPRFTVLVGGKEDRCGLCRGVLLIAERGYCSECRPVARKRALARISIASLASGPDGAA